MVSLIAAAAVSIQQEGLLKTLTAVYERYRTAKECRVTIQHLNSTSIYPGAYEQQLTWTDDRRFTLKVTRRGEGAVDVPRWESDGRNVTATLRNGTTIKAPRRQRRELTPPWEMSAGTLFSMLDQTDRAEMFFKKTAKIRVPKHLRHLYHGEEVVAVEALELRQGSRASLGKRDCIEIEVLIKNDESSEQIGSLLLSADKKRLIGEMIVYPDFSGYRVYLDESLISK